MANEKKETIVPEFTKNKNGVTIKKCCASCATHEPYDDKGPRRLCTLSHKVVQKDDLCGRWRISDAIDGIQMVVNL